MSYLDWLELAHASHGEEMDWFKGSCNVTIGDALLGFFGARHTHVFGPDIKVVCDLEDMLVTHGLERLLPGVSGLLAGIGGNVTFCYGSNINATYVGPKIEIRRAKEIKKLGSTLTKGNDTTNLTDETDRAMAIVVGILSALMLLTAALTELALHFSYPEFGKEGSESENSKHGMPPELLKTLSYTITARLMELIKQIETSATWAELGEEYLKSLKRFGLIVASPFLLAAMVLGLIAFLSVFIPKTERVTGTLAMWGFEAMCNAEESAKYLAAV